MNIIKVNNTDMLVKEIKGERVVTFSDIDLVHGREPGTAKYAFARNRERFSEGKDYFSMTRKEYSERFGDSKILKGNPYLPMFAITESGYLMIVKTFGDDLAWEVQRKLVESYFKSKNAIVSTNENDFQKRIMDIVEADAKRNEEFRQTILDSFNMLSRLLLNGNTVKHIETEENQSQNIPEEKPTPQKKLTEYSKWKREIMNMIPASKRNEILANTYKYMTRIYGICWEQEKKELAAENGYCYSTLQVAYAIDCRKNTRNLFTNSIKNIMNDDQDFLFIIRDRAIKAGNKSMNACSAITSFISFVNGKESIDWDNYYKKYERDHPGKSFNKSAVIREYSDLYNVCRKYVTEFLDAKYPLT